MGLIPGWEDALEQEIGNPLQLDRGSWQTIAHQVTKSWTQLSTHAIAAKPLQLCLTLCDPTDGGPPGSPIPGILQARTLEWAYEGTIFHI